MDRLRHLLDHPDILAANPSARPVLALPPCLALQNTSAALDRNVGCRRRHHGSVAWLHTLHQPMDVVSRYSFILRGTGSLQTVSPQFLPGPTRRTTRSSARPRPPAPR